MTTHKHTHHHTPDAHDSSGANRFLPEVNRIRRNAVHDAEVRNVATAAAAYACALADLQTHHRGETP